MNHNKYKWSKVGRDIKTAALIALAHEPFVWPRFGLVGPMCTGSHHDMDYAVLLHGSESIASYVTNAFESGARNNNFQHFELLRMMGKQAETKMLQDTGGINTHKGSIFLLGIIAFWLGHFHYKNVRPRLGELLQIARSTCEIELIADLQRVIAGYSESYGEWAFRRYKLRGIRGVVLDDFVDIKHAMSWFFQYSEVDKMLRYGNLRLFFLAKSEDTNIVKRVGFDEAMRIRRMAVTALCSGGVFTMQGLITVRAIENKMLLSGCSAAAAGDMVILAIFFDQLVQQGLINVGSVATSERQTLRKKIAN